MKFSGKIATFAKPQNVTGHAKRRHSRHKQKVKRQTKWQRFAKLKELQSQTQADTICSTFNLPNRTQAHP